MSSDIHAFLVPKWGLSMEDARVILWHVAEGAMVRAGDELVDLETPKIMNGVESPVAGTLRRIVAGPGETVVVGQLLGVIAGADVDSVAIDTFVKQFQASSEPVEPVPTKAAGTLSIEAAGRRIGYVVAGPKDEDVIPALLIHGFGGDCNNWIFNLDVLAKDRRVYALDLPGHGVSSKDVGDGSLAALATAVLAFMDAMGIASAHLIGHSLGGGVALEVVHRNPNRAVSLALIAPIGLGVRINEKFIRGFVDSQSKRDIKPVLQLLVADPSVVTGDMIDNVLKYKRLDGVTDALRRIADAVFTNAEQAAGYRDILAQFNGPMTLICGRQDSITGPADAEKMPERVEVHLLENAGHMPHMEASGVVNELLHRHVRRQT